ncbi:hypothetical protein C0J52_22632, partial [Blattella germanica]
SVNLLHFNIKCLLSSTYSLHKIHLLSSLFPLKFFSFLIPNLNHANPILCLLLISGLIR